jgi:hypothetical protein
VFENIVWGKTFVCKADEVRRGWRILNIEGLKDLYSSPDNVLVMKLRRIKRTGHVARMGKKKVVYRVLLGESEGKRPLCDTQT